jgi:hypothetical protein
MKTFTLALNLLGNCLTWIVSLPTCLTVLFIVFLTRPSNPNLLFTRSLRRLFISAFPSPVHSLQIRTQFKRFCNPAYPHLNIRFIFRSSKRISYFFPFKDKVPKFLRSGVVYLFKCRCCSIRVVCGSNHAPFMHQSIGTPGTDSYNRTAVIQSSHV